MKTAETMIGDHYEMETAKARIAQLEQGLEETAKECDRLTGLWTQTKDETNRLRFERDTYREALEWIAKGPTYGPGAPALEAQAYMASERARVAFAKVRK